MDRENVPLIRRQNADQIRLGWRTKFACFTVLSTETLERVAFYGLVGNLVLFLNVYPFNWIANNAMNAMLIFTGVSYISSIFSGWLSDAVLGKYKSVILFFFIYLIGYVFFPVFVWKPLSWCGLESTNYSHSTTASPPTRVAMYTEPCFWAISLSLIIIAIGNGGVKSTIAPFGADQVRRFGPALTRTFFNWYYWCINIGSFFALGGIAYVQQEKSFKWGYTIPSICLALALIMFLAGSVVYVRKPCTGSVMSNVCKVLWEGCQRSRNTCCCKKRRSNFDECGLLADQPYGCLDAAKIRYGGSFHDNLVDDVKTLGKIMLVFLSLIPYWMVYFQMETTFQIQGLHMRLAFKGNGTMKEDSGFTIPTAWLSLFDVIFLIFLLPLFDRVVYPRLDRAGYKLSLRLRISIGMLCAAASVAVAGGVEMARLNCFYWHNLVDWQQGHAKYPNSTFNQWIGRSGYHAADMSVLWQIPQYALIGVSEVFASVAGLELAYTSAPRSMVSLIMGLFWFTQGAASLAGSATLSAFTNVWFSTKDHGDINCRLNGKNQDLSEVQFNATQEDKSVVKSCHLDFYFFFLAALQIFALLIFIVMTHWLGMGGTKSTNQNNNNGDHVRDESTNQSSVSNSHDPFAGPRHTRNAQQRSISSSDSTSTNSS